MDDDKKRALQKQLENAVLPRGTGGARSYDSTPTAKLPNWNFWKHSPDALPWQACALALNFDPDSIKRSPQAWMVGGGDVFMMSSFPSNEVAQQHTNLMRLLEANRYNKQCFTNLHSDKVKLSEFVLWCAPVVRDLIGRDIPPDLAALAKAATQAAPLVEAAPAKLEPVPVVTPSGDGW